MLSLFLYYADEMEFQISKSDDWHHSLPASSRILSIIKFVSRNFGEDVMNDVNSLSKVNVSKRINMTVRSTLSSLY